MRCLAGVTQRRSCLQAAPFPARRPPDQPEPMPPGQREQCRAVVDPWQSVRGGVHSVWEADARGLGAAVWLIRSDRQLPVSSDEPASTSG